MTRFISKKNNLNTHYKNLGISANVNLASRNINTSEPWRNGQVRPQIILFIFFVTMNLQLFLFTSH